MSKRSVLTVAFAALTGALLAAGPAYAAEDDEAAVRDWARAVNLDPGWRVRIVGMESTSRVTRIDRLTVRHLGDSTARVVLEDMVISGQVNVEEGALSAGAIAVRHASLVNDDVALHFDNLSLKRPELPDFRSFRWNADRPLGSGIAGYGLLARFAMDNLSAGKVTLDESAEGVTSRITYDMLALDDWRDGVIGSVSTGTMRMSAPEPEGLVRMSVGGFSGTDINLRAIAGAFDPAGYADGKADRAWRDAVGSAVYEGIGIDLPDAALTIGRLENRDLKVRQAPESFVEYLDDAQTKPELLDDPETALRHAYGVLSSLQIGSFTMDDIEVVATGIEQLSMSRFHLEDFSTDRIGEISFEGLKAEVLGEGYLDLGKVAFGDMNMPDQETVLGAIQEASFDPSLDTLDFEVLPGFVELAEVDTRAGDFPRLSLGRFRIDVGDYVDGLPSKFAVDIERARFPTWLAIDGRRKQLLDQLGYEDIDADLRFSADWDREAGTVEIDDLRFAMRDLGALQGHARLEGVEEDAVLGVADIASAREAALAFEFAGGDMTFADDSIVARGLRLQAERMQVETEVFREQIAGALPFMISFVGTPEFQREIVPVLQTFIRTPGEITVKSEPREVLALGELRKLFRTAPQDLPGLLGVSLDGVAGEPGDGQIDDDEGDDLRPTIRR